MDDYRAPISKAQKRRQLKRLSAIMGGMVLAFVIFMLGVRVGTQWESDRVHISHGTPPPSRIGKGEGPPGRGKMTKAPSAPEKEQEEMKFTFYETLTKKEGPDREIEREEKGGRERLTVTSPPTGRVKELKKVPEKKDLYFVQVGSFREEGKAEALRNRLANRGYRTQLVPVEIEGRGLWYRVRLGGYKSLKQAQAVKDKVAAEEDIKGARIITDS
ncbi:MAG: SPOR domain-containing protein [Deltaproteobacteria bacterium]|nr:MAG: SPOR domain-containing protein [Deltaproteobacteria bacterium]